MCEHREKRVQGGGGKQLLPQLKELAAISPGWASLTGMSPSCPYAMPQTGHNKEEGGFPTRASICYRPHNEQTLLLPFPTSHPPIIFFFFFAKMFSEAQAGESTTRGWQHQRLNAALHSKVSPLIASGAGPSAPSSPPRALGPMSVPQDRRGDGMPSKGHPSQRVFHQSNLRASDTLQQFLHPRGVRIHAHFP